jgi:membrane-associated phospholipid phosphatase
MLEHASGLRRLDNTIWTLIAGVGVSVLVASAFGGFHIVLNSYTAAATAGALLLGTAYYYRVRRADLKLASALESTAQLLIFAAVAAPLSYLAAGCALPLQDAAFDAMDRALGFNWGETLAFMSQRPVFFDFMRTIYLSLTLQMTAVVLLLAFTGRLGWLRLYMLAFIFAAVVTIAISALLPAEGAWLHYGLKGDQSLMPVSHTSWPVFHALRDGSYRLVMAVGSEGIITFPSLHAALAIILIAAFWPIPVARWISAAINVMMLAATPIDGSHYLVDVLAGIAVAALCLVAAHKLADRVMAVPSVAMNSNVEPAVRSAASR